MFLISELLEILPNVENASWAYLVAHALCCEMASQGGACEDKDLPRAVQQLARKALIYCKPGLCGIVKDRTLHVFFSHKLDLLCVWHYLLLMCRDGS